MFNVEFFENTTLVCVQKMHTLPRKSDLVSFKKHTKQDNIEYLHTMKIQTILHIVDPLASELMVRVYCVPRD